jgi:hypothetical protein
LNDLFSEGNAVGSSGVFRFYRNSRKTKKEADKGRSVFPEKEGASYDGLSNAETI